MTSTNCSAGSKRKAVRACADQRHPAALRDAALGEIMAENWRKGAAILSKTAEQRIADLERRVRELEEKN
ncbi:MAG: hypothetical protein ABR589_10795, partial [Chthoniobacterales bacterium]